MPQLNEKQVTQQLNAISNAAMTQKQRFISDVLTPKPDVLYSPGDYKTLRTLIYDNVKQAVTKRFPLSNQRYILDIQDLDYADPQDVSLKDQKKAIMENTSVGRRLRGSWVLRDAVTNKQIAKTAKTTLLKVPYITDRGTFIRSGSQYTFNTIMRLQPGVYTKRNTDDQISAQFNVKRGTGAGFGMKFTPSSGIFYITKGTRNVPAYAVMHDMGISDAQMEKSWGKELFLKNKEAGTTERAAGAMQQLYRS